MSSTGIPVSQLIEVDVNLTPAGAQFANFNTGLVLGSSSVIDVVERMRNYASLAEVAADFGTSADEYLAADNWFSQQPSPNSLNIGRWAKNATPAQLVGGPVSAANQLLSAWTGITNGAFLIQINGEYYSVNGLNFSAVSNLNGVASVIQIALAALLASTTCVWNSVYSDFEITSPTTGAASTISFLKAPTSSGHISFSANPADGSSITLDGTAVTFVASGPIVGNEVLIGGTLADTLAALLTFLNASADVNLVKFVYSLPAAGSILSLAAKTAGAGGDSLTLVASSSPNSHGTVSGATLSGGTGTDISAMLAMLSTSSGAYIANGIAAETAVAAVTLFDSMFSSQWYGLMVCGASDSDHQAIAAYIEGATTNAAHFYAVTTSEGGVLVSSDTSDIAYLLSQAGYERTAVQYSSQPPANPNNAFSAWSMLSRILAVDYTQPGSTITLMYKQEPGITPESLSVPQLSALLAKDCNVFVGYNNGTAIIQPGTTCKGAGIFIDTIIGLDWLRNQIQTDVFNVFYTTPTKIPQTDPGQSLIFSAIKSACEAALNNGLLGPGTWDSPQVFGQLTQGFYLSRGYYIYQPPIATQPQASRAARQSVPFTVGVKLAGATHLAKITVNVNL